mmetsp:Transcript_6121/g.13465  ORF Transcript_6121/g.13465 Transcript_6121/m.13465 type:complete len:437 (-) Transcript_6121:726-2036(-)
MPPYLGMHLTVFSFLLSSIFVKMSNISSCVVSARRYALAAAYSSNRRQTVAFGADTLMVASPSSSASTRISRSTSSVTNNVLLAQSRRNFCSTSTKLRMSIADTPLGNGPGADLLDGLDVYTVPASEDGHPITVYGINSDQNQIEEDKSTKRRAILMLHGRTWSSVPVYHLLGGPRHAAQNKPGRESRSLMEALYDAGMQPYAMDFRGFGGTPPDASGWVEPNRCVADVEAVLQFVSEHHPTSDASSAGNNDLPALMGWSQGALVAQLVGQKAPDLMSQLVLYGSIYDPLVRYPRSPLYVENPDRRNETQVKNEYDGAIEDFTVEGSIPPEPARLFAEAALLSDPIKAHWNHLYQFNNCDPARVHVPTLVVAGDQDPYAPLRVQSELFTNLGRGADRSWSIIADADHAVHLLDGRERFVNIVKSFVDSARKGLGHA